MQSERKYKIYHNFIAFYEKILSCKRKKSFIINFVLLKYNWITLKITYEKNSTLLANYHRNDFRGFVGTFNVAIFLGERLGA
ncbi:hypothetical protein CCAN2_1220008 [Capnocytophaga canimorsus]|nr:hypothetical protein CCAN2_1220008 [Capnocytophaga canimorsus]